MIDRDTVVEFIESRRKTLIAVTAGILFLLLLVLAVRIGSFDSQNNKAARLAAERRAQAVSAEDLWIPGEPLQVPGLQFFRERKTNWSAEEVNQWYTEPDAASLGELDTAGRKVIDRLLESVP